MLACCICVQIRSKGVVLFVSFMLNNYLNTGGLSI